jgi:SAM-dependent methyltransferase
MTDSSTRRDALAKKIFESNLALYDVATIYLGDRLGLYAALARQGAATSSELARRTGTHERYVREWLEQQAIAEILDVEDPAAAALERKYELPAGHAEVLLDRDSLSYLAPLARFSVGVLTGLPKLLDAFRRGGGVPYPDYGVDAREGQADVNRTLFVNLLGSQWLPAIADVHDRLRADPPARVADIACGTGWSSLSLARAYPKIRVDGFDLDDASIELAKRNAVDQKLADRVTFSVRDAADPQLRGTYDLATIFEALHDMPQPVRALAAVRALLNDGGTAIIVDERVHESFTWPSGGERLFYSWSVLFCLPTGMADQPSAGTGAVMRPDTLRGYARAAGFRDVEVLPIENDLWRFYRLRR